MTVFGCLLRKNDARFTRCVYEVFPCSGEVHAPASLFRGNVGSFAFKISFPQVILGFLLSLLKFI
jgi:hypothetical protein